MKCNEVKEKLPEYLAGVLDDPAMQEIKLHLESCEFCRKEAGELNETLPASGDLKKIDMKKVLKKTNRKFNIRIVKVIAVIVFIAWALYMIPLVLWGFWSFSQPNASRALMDIVQFSQPEKVNSWGNHSVDRLSLSVPLRITTRSVTGKSYGIQKEYIGMKSVITGKITAPVFLGSNFIHPENFKGADLGDIQNPQAQKQRLQKNAGTTVATVDYSLDTLLSLQDMANLLRGHDVEICWMAVESGVEKTVPKNMTFENQQVLQWGIPGKLSKPGAFDYAVFGVDTAESFEEAVLDEMKWLDEKKNLLRPDSGLLKNNAIDTGIGDKAGYLLTNGIKIYGLRATGPSSELLKLSESLAPRAMTVVDMDFWNW